MTRPSKRLAGFALSLSLAGVAAASPPAVAEKPEGWAPRRPAVEASKPATPVPVLVERLRSPRFADRASATRELSRGGLAAVGPLRAAAADDSPEVAIRAVSALENLWLRAMDVGEDAVAEAALVALDDLTASGDPGQRARIESLLSTHDSLVQKFAINKIRQLGGSVRFDPHQSDIDERGNLRPVIKYVVVGTAWTGGEEGLRHIRRARPQNGVYFIRGVDLPEGAAERFSVETNIPFQERGPSYLGVQSSSILGQVEPGCVVESAEPGTPADKAGIRPRDVIVEFNGKQIRVFEQLVKEIENTRPGQTVEAVVKRLEPDPAAPGGFKAVLTTLEVTMEEWR